MPSNQVTFDVGVSSGHILAEDTTDNHVHFVFDKNAVTGCGDILGFTKLGEYGGHGYYLSNASAPWQQAKILAENEGGYLVTMNDQAENDFLKDQLNGNMVFIGYNDAMTEGVGQWADNEQVILDLSYGNSLG